MIATIVETDVLAETVVAAFVAGVGTTLVFSLAILGVARFGEAAREGRALESFLYGALAVFGTLATAGAAVLGVIVMAAK
jgi:hypothetical protein